MNRSIHQRRARSLALLIMSSLVAVAMLTAVDASMRPASAGQWGGVGSTSGGGGTGCNGFGASWKLYGSKNKAKPSNAPTGTSAAWTAFTKDAKEWCKGFGYNDLPSSLEKGCKKSAFIWAYMTSGSGKSGFLSNARSSAGYGGDRNDTAATVKQGFDRAASGGSAYYKDAKAYLKGRVDVAFRSTDRVTLACSFAWDDDPDDPNYWDDVTKPTPPTFKDNLVDACDGRDYYAGGTYKIPARTGVQYQIKYWKKQSNGKYAWSAWMNKAAGAYSFVPPVGVEKAFHVRAVAKTGFVFQSGAKKQWSWDFVSQAPPTCVNPQPPVFVAPQQTGCDLATYYVAGGKITIPAVTGVQYYYSTNPNDDGRKIGAGQHVQNGNVKVYVWAKPISKAYALAAGSTRSWNFFYPRAQALPTCSTNSKTFTHYQYRTVTTYENGGDEWKAKSPVSSPQPFAVPIFWNTVVESGGPDVGRHDFEEQSNGDFTPFGKLLESNPDPTSAEVAAAIAATNEAKHMALDLSEANKRALAEGGVLDVKEYTTFASVTAGASTIEEQSFSKPWTKKIEQQQRRERQADESWTLVNGVKTLSSIIYGPFSSWEDFGEPVVTTTEGATTSAVNYYVDDQVEIDETSAPELTGQWQALATHCNAEGATAANGLSITQITNRDPLSNWSASLVSTVARDGNDPQWGFAAEDPAGTDSDGFFDKLCAYNGDRTGDETDAPSTSTFFRDNEFHTLKADLYRPRAEGVVKASDENATRTLLTRWDKGTPLPDNTSARGSMRSQTTDGQKLFGAEEQAPTLKNFTTVERGSGKTWSIVGGQHTDLQFGANWASDSGKPQVFSVRWEYAPNVENTVPVNNVGFAGVGGAQSYSTGVVSTAVQGIVQGATSGPTTPALFEEVAANTGTDATNALDGNLLYGTSLDAASKWTVAPTSWSRFYKALNFVRATAE